MILSEKLKEEIEKFLNGFSLNKQPAVANSFGALPVFQFACNGGCMASCLGGCADGCTSCAGSNK